MSRALQAFLDGSFAGTFSQSDAGDLTFSYDEQFRAREGATPLSLSMPLTAARHRKRSVLPFLQGLLPDSDQALRAIGRRFGASERNPFALLEFVGADVAGALEILPPGIEPSDAEKKPQEPDALTEHEVEVLLDHTVTEYSDGVPFDDTAGRFSVAGAQPKIALHRREDGRWSRAGGAYPTTHIIKPVVGSLRRIDVVEWMTMSAARELGLQVADAQLTRIGHWSAFVSARYDRVKKDDSWRRIHQEDLCQALAVSPQKKYQRRDGGPGTAAIGELLRSLPLSADRSAAQESFFRGFAFNTIAACTDAHAKNYSLLLDGTHVRLAPLYDLASYTAYWNRESPIEIAMSVGGEYRLSRISADSLAAEGRRFGLPSGVSKDIVEEMRRALPRAFEHARDALNHNAESQEIADDMIRGIRALPLVAAT